MLILLLLPILGVFIFGVVAAFIGKGGYRWLALASGVASLAMVISAVVILLGAGVVAIGTNGSLAQIILLGCLVCALGALVLCIVTGSIAIKRKRAFNAEKAFIKN